MSEVTRNQRRQWREDAENERTHSGCIYGDPKRILALLDALDEMERQRDDLDHDGSEWRRAYFDARARAYLARRETAGSPR